MTLDWLCSDLCLVKSALSNWFDEIDRRTKPREG